VVILNTQLKEIIQDSENIVFFGGAGVSTASGIPDFRSTDGLYSQKYDYPPEVIISHTFFIKHTDVFYKFYRDKMIYLDAKPNTCHQTLAKLEKEGKLKAVITQNIDGLHQAAGSKRVYELHGSVYRNFCMDCGSFYTVNHIINTQGIPRCTLCGGIVKPDVVLYEESLDNECINGAIDAISKADVLIVGGTSLTVYPAASFINCFCGRKLVLINKTPTPADKIADLVIREGIAGVMELDG
jgi:NAD-dependent deacetylase